MEHCALDELLFFNVCEELPPYKENMDKVLNGNHNTQKGFIIRLQEHPTLRYPLPAIEGVENWKNEITKGNDSVISSYIDIVSNPRNYRLFRVLNYEFATLCLSVFNKETIRELFQEELKNDIDTFNDDILDLFYSNFVCNGCSSNVSEILSDNLVTLIYEYEMEKDVLIGLEKSWNESFIHFGRDGKKILNVCCDCFSCCIRNYMYSLPMEIVENIINDEMFFDKDVYQIAVNNLKHAMNGAEEEAKVGVILYKEVINLRKYFTVSEIKSFWKYALGYDDQWKYCIKFEDLKAFYDQL